MKFDFMIYLSANLVFAWLYFILKLCFGFFGMTFAIGKLYYEENDLHRNYGTVMFIVKFCEQRQLY